MAKSPRAIDKLRVMLDANVLIAGSVWPRWSYEVVQHALQGDFQLVLAPLVIDQARRRVATRFPLQVERLETFLRQSQYAEAPDPSPVSVRRNLHLVRDETDVPIALAAIQAKVYCLVSDDKDLTADDETTAGLRKLLTVMRPVIFLREVLGWTSEALERVHKRTWQDLLPPQHT